MTVRLLEFLGGLTIAIGTIGAFGSLMSFCKASVFADNVTREDVPGAVAALIMPPAFALILRLAFYEPVVWSLRRKFGLNDPARTDYVKLRGRLKVAMIVVTAILVVEGTRAIIFMSPGEPEKPVHDTTVLAIGMDPGSDDRSPDNVPKDPEDVKPILVKFFQGRSGTECHVDGKILIARPGNEDEIHERILQLRREYYRRPVEIEVPLDLTFQHFVDVIDACIKVKVAMSQENRNTDSSGFRILIPMERPSTFTWQIRLVWRDTRSRELVRLQLPESEMAEPLSTVEERGWYTSDQDQ